MELIKIWEIIWRRRWIIIQAFLVISLAAVIGSFVVTPTYETSAKVLIETSDTVSSLLSSIGLQNFSPKLGSKTGVETNIELATVDPVLNKVILALQLKDDKGNLIKPSKLLETSFVSPEPHVEIKNTVDTDLIEIIASSPDPKEAAMLANTLAEVYIEEKLKRRRAEYRSARTFIEDRIKLAKADYLNALEDIKRFKITEKTVNLEKETKMAIDRMAELMKEKADNVIDIYETRAKIETLKKQLGKQNEMFVSSAAIDKNPHIENLKKQITSLELQLTEELAEKTKDHPDVVVIAKKNKKVREELRSEMDVFRETSVDLETLERELPALEAHRKGVNKDIKEHLTKLYTIPEKTFTQSQLELELSASQVLYSALLEYLYQIGVAEAMTISDILLVEPATEPDIDKPESPKKALNAIMGVFLGLMFGFALAFLVDYLDDTIKTPEEVKEQELTFLGAIPQIGRKESHIISERDPKDPLFESYRSIRNSIKFASLDKPIKSLLITSALPGEGKTTTAVNLAISMTRESKEVLVMDTDFLNPKMHEIFKLQASMGITNILAGEATVEEAIQKTDIESLSLLASGPTPPDPGQMIESSKLRELIKYLAQKYDFIILDTPPVLSKNDAVLLSGYVDDSVLILGSGETTRSALSHVRDLLKQANIQLIGTILNKFRMERGGYYSYYGYYEGKKK